MNAKTETNVKIIFIIERVTLTCKNQQSQTTMLLDQDYQTDSLHIH